MKKYVKCKFRTILCRTKFFANTFTVNYLKQSWKGEKIHLCKCWKQKYVLLNFFIFNMMFYAVDKSEKVKIMMQKTLRWLFCNNFRHKNVSSQNYHKDSFMLNITILIFLFFPFWACGIKTALWIWNILFLYLTV